jgi:hypothetical protein
MLLTSTKHLIVFIVQYMILQVTTTSIHFVEIVFVLFGTRFLQSFKIIGGSVHHCLELMNSWLALIVSKSDFVASVNLVKRSLIIFVCCCKRWSRSTSMLKRLATCSLWMRLIFTYSINSYLLGRRMSIQKMLRKRIPLHPSWNYIIFTWINR